MKVQYPLLPVSLMSPASVARSHDATHARNPLSLASDARCFSIKSS